MPHADEMKTRTNAADTRSIALANGRGIARVDADDYDRISKYHWQRHVHGYAYRTSSIAGHRITHLMHRVVLGASMGTSVDHIDGDKLNNTKANLRLCTRHENQRNRAATKIGLGNRHSAYKGVTIYNGRWGACIRVNGQTVWLGRFESEIDAACAYDDAARTNFGAFASVNFPKAGERGALS